MNAVNTTAAQRLNKVWSGVFYNKRVEYTYHLVSVFFFTATRHSVPENCGLIPTALDSLSPQHSAVFLFGCQVMRLLSNCPLFPPVLLLLAKSVPVSSLNEVLLTHCSKDFYFDETNQILYLSEEKLQHVGHFISTVLQSMAYIAAGNPEDRSQ